MRKSLFVLSCCLLLSACSSTESKEEEVVKAPVAVMPPVKVTTAWLDTYESSVREAVKGTAFEFERRKTVLVVTAPVKGSFNPDRPEMLLPISLGPITRVAKLLEADKEIAVLVLGHADSSGDNAKNRLLSEQRARAVTSIFRLSGLTHSRLQVMGLGSDSPRAANDSAAGRDLNRRVEIILTSQDTMAGLIAQYSQPAKSQLESTEQVAEADQGKTAKAK